jgi:large subunit ribosomal protein L25
MDQLELKVNKREVLGKKVRFLRRQGITPVHLFGRDIKSEALQCDTNNLKSVLAEAGHTGLINLRIASEKKPRTAVVREIQLGLRPGELLHVDFYQVKMAEAVKVDVPIVLIGEAPALKNKENTLVHELIGLAVECLPSKIPPSVELDITILTESNQSIRVKDIELGKDVTVLSDPEQVLVRITSRQIGRVEEVEEVVEEVEAETEAEAAEAEAAEAPKAEAVSKEETKEE